MRRYLVFGCVLVLAICLSSCGDDDSSMCPSNITDAVSRDIHYNKMSSCGPEYDPSGNFTRYYTNWEDYESDSTNCSIGPIPQGLGFDGVILGQGVKLPFVSDNEDENPAYQLDVKLFLDDCAKHVDFHFMLTNVDTSYRFEHNRDVLVLLDGVDSTYTVDFSHEVIPFEE